LGIQEAYFTYAEGEYGIATYLRKLQHFRSSLQGTLKTTLKEEIQKINKNALRNFPSAEASKQQEVSIHVDDLVKSFMQNCQDKIQCQQNDNLELRKHNTFLTAQKEALANMDDALLKIFHENCLSASH